MSGLLRWDLLSFDIRMWNWCFFVLASLHLGKSPGLVGYGKVQFVHRSYQSQPH